MGRLGWLPAAALGGATATALAVCLWAFYRNGRDEAAIAAVILCLSLAQLVFFVAKDARRAREIRRLKQAAEDEGHLAERVAALEDRLAEEDEEPTPAAPPHDAKPSLIDEVKQLRSSLHEIAAQAGAKTPAASPRPSAVPIEDRLDLYLEPLVALSTQATQHYRVSLGLEAAGGHRSEHEALYAEADRSGLRAALDVFALQRALPVARRLIVKRPEARIFIPVGAATLTKPGYLAEIERLIGTSRHVAQGLVFEIAHATLAKLDGAGIEGLARLARQGPLLGLHEAAATGLDLGALRGLRFRYLSFRASAAPPDLQRLTGLAMGQGFEIIATDVRTIADRNTAMRWALLARGPAFAAPRLVRPDPAGERSAQAA